jgi:hypothetical protein
MQIAVEPAATSRDTSGQSRAYLLVLALFVPILLAVFGLAIIQRPYEVGSDYYNQALDAKALIETGDTIKLRANPLTMWSIIAVHSLLPNVDYLTSALYVGLLYSVFVGITLYFVIGAAFGDWSRTFGGALLAAALAVSLMVVTPVTMPTWAMRNLYYGYIGVNTYHNPSILALKPFALLVSLFVVAALVQPMRFRSIVAIVSCAILMALSVLAKPNFALCLLPALAIIAGYKLLKRQAVNWPLVVVGIALPALALLTYQYLFTYGGDSAQDSDIIFAPLTALSLKDRLVLLPPKFFLSILFPLSVYALYFKTARHSVLLNLAWLMFLFGAFQMYFLAETGERLHDGNFFWSGHITLFLLFVASVVFVTQQKPISITAIGTWEMSPRFVVIVMIFGLHLVSGFLYYSIYAADTLLGLDPARWV